MNRAVERLNDEAALHITALVSGKGSLRYDGREVLVHSHRFFSGASDN